MGDRGGAAELALPSAADLLGAGPDDATGGSSFLGGSKLCDNGAWEGHRDMQAQVRQELAPPPSPHPTHPHTQTSPLSPFPPFFLSQGCGLAMPDVRPRAVLS